MVTVLWSFGPRRLELHTDGLHRTVALVEGEQLLGLWRLPPRDVARGAEVV